MSLSLGGFGEYYISPPPRLILIVAFVDWAGIALLPLRSSFSSLTSDSTDAMSYAIPPAILIDSCVGQETINRADLESAYCDVPVELTSVSLIGKYRILASFGDHVNASSAGGCIGARRVTFAAMSARAYDLSAGLREATTAFAPSYATGVSPNGLLVTTFEPRSSNTRKLSSH